jgi:protein-tyrosine-phosphatase
MFFAGRSIERPYNRKRFFGIGIYSALNSDISQPFFGHNMIKILILCRGNITRSPFVAGYLNYMYRNSKLYSENLLDIDSSGVEGKHDRPVHPRVLERGLELGFDLSVYRSKHSGLKAFEAADLIFVLDKRQLDRFVKVYSHLLYKTYHLYDFGRKQAEEVLDFQDPSEENREEDFKVFFKFAEPEVKRVWSYLEAKYQECKAENVPFTGEVFYKKNLPTDVQVKRYRNLSRRLFPMCPYCQSKRIRRVKREGFMQKKVWPLLNGYPYHCGNCDKGFILFIGSELKSTRRESKKQAAWNFFEEREKKIKDSTPNGNGSKE